MAVRPAKAELVHDVADNAAQPNLLGRILHTYGLYIYGLYSYGLHSYGLVRHFAAHACWSRPFGRQT